MHAQTVVIETTTAGLLPGDEVLGWVPGDPARAEVVRVEPRPVLTVTTGPLQWVYDVHYSNGHASYSQDGNGLRKVRRPIPAPDFV